MPEKNELPSRLSQPPIFPNPQSNEEVFYGFHVQNVKRILFCIKLLFLAGYHILLILTLGQVDFLLHPIRVVIPGDIFNPPSPGVVPVVVKQSPEWFFPLLLSTFAYFLVVVLIGLLKLKFFGKFDQETKACLILTIFTVFLWLLLGWEIKFPTSSVAWM